MSGGKVVRIIARLNLGGPAQQAVGLSAGMAQMGWDTLLLAGHPDPSEGNMEFLLEGRPIRFLRIPPLQRSLHPLKDLRAGWSILRCLLRERPDILHTHTAKAGALGRLAGLAYRWITRSKLKMVHTFHGHVLEGYFHPAAAGFFCWIERRLGAFTDVLLTVSDSVREDLLRLRIGPASKIRVIRLGLPLENLLALDPPRFGQGPLKIGSIGRLAPIKNHGLLLEAIRRLNNMENSHDSHFLIVGDGELRPALEQQIQDKGLSEKVEMTGWKTDLPALYRDLHAVCLTSKNEGTPVALIEAMAAARPVVATEVGGVRDLVGYGNDPIAPGKFRSCERGILVRSEDPEGLAQALRFILSEPEAARRMGEAGRRFAAEHYTLKRLIQDVDTLYGEFAKCSN